MLWQLKLLTSASCYNLNSLLKYRDSQTARFQASSLPTAPKNLDGKPGTPKPLFPSSRLRSGNASPVVKWCVRLSSRQPPTQCVVVQTRIFARYGQKMWAEVPPLGVATARPRPRQPRRAAVASALGSASPGTCCALPGRVSRRSP